MYTCDKCQKDFNIFTEGKANSLWIVCGKCWATELRSRNFVGA